MPTLPLFRPLFLQAAEVTKLAVDAAGAVGGHTAKDPVQAILWLAILSLVGITYWQWRKAEKATDAKHLAETSAETGKTAAVKAALTEARTEWAKEMANDLGHEQSLFAQMREQYQNEIQRLREDNKEKDRQLIESNKELRLQEAKNSEVLGATAASLRVTAKAAQANGANIGEVLRVLQVAFPNIPVRPTSAPDLL